MVLVVPIPREEVNDIALYIRENYNELKDKFVRSYSRLGLNETYFEDLFHEALYSGIKCAHKRNPDGNKENWLRAIFRRTAIDYFFRGNKCLPLQFSQLGPNGLDPGSFPDKDGNPLNLAIIRETRRLVHEELLNLSPIHYQIIDLYLYSIATTMKEISDELKINEKTVRTRLNRAKESLRKGLSQSLVDLV